ncbi:MAG: Cys-Gln thioester bond-forming surface protein [Bacilli bacterium]|nr:Cys-Gln thioester bond-forming surface protein [Bacilli bacterium]
MNKYQYSTNTIYYQQARVFRRTNDHAMAYCLEPFVFFDENKNYTPTVNPRNLSKAQIDRISKIAHFGLGYKKHNTTKWYAITQLMIWQTADTSGDYYFTDGLNGPRINPYQSEIQEINNLIKEYDKLPSFNNKTYTVIEGNNLVVEDTNNIITSFKSNDNLTITDNKITLNNIKEGNYNYTFTKQDNYYNKPIIFYQANGSQNLVNYGDLNDLNASFKVKAIHTKIELSKIDQDNKSTTPRGEATLDGAVYKLYDTNDNLIHTFTINDNYDVLNNIDFGKYYLLEDTPGIGYTLDTNKYEINIAENNPTIQLTLENKVIEKKIIIEKKYGDNNKLMNEENISFNIFNSNDELIETVITDENGLIEITLPYGKYKIVQINSTDGYSKIEPFTVEVSDNEEERIELKDLRIPVPNTRAETSLFLLIIRLVLILL